MVPLALSTRNSVRAPQAKDEFAEPELSRLQQLMNNGKEKGYVLYDALSGLPADLNNGNDLDDLAGLDAAGIEILEEAKLEFDKKPEETEELLDLELPPGVGAKINDPVRMYLREMGTVPLLTREREVEIARRIERGQKTLLKTLSRSPLVIQEILWMAEEVERGTLSIGDVVTIEGTDSKITTSISNLKYLGATWNSPFDLYFSDHYFKGFGKNYTLKQANGFTITVEASSDGKRVAMDRRVLVSGE